MNSNFAKNLKQFKTLLFDGQHALAEQSLSQMQGQDAREKRVIGHQHGILKMRQGDFKSAIETLTQNLQDNGENLGCLLDLAACYYLDSQFFNWQKVLDHATQVFDQIHELLSAERVVITYLTLGKFIEEKGELAKALAYYQRAKEISEKRKFESFFAINALRAEAQILRLHLQYRSHKELTALYESLANHNSTDTDVDCDFEVQHALMLAEVRIFGLKVALARLANLQKNPIMQTAEASLIYSDLVTEFLLQGEKPAPELVAKFLQCASTSILDQSLSALINGKTIDLERIIFLKKQMPKAPYLRLLKILMSLGIETKSLSFIILKAIHSLGTETKKMWIEFQNIRVEQTTHAIQF